MTKTTLLGLIFLLTGLGVIAAAVVPVFSHPPVSINVWVLLAGIGVAILGALMIQPKGTKDAIDTIAVTVENSNIPMLGGHGRREEDHTATATKVTVATEDKG